MNKYSGNKEPYVYGLFTKNDEAEALKVLENLSEKGFKVTYDEKKKSDCIGRASSVLLFVSKDMMKDEEILKDLSDAINKDKNVIAIFLEECELTPGLSMTLGQTQGILKYQINEEEFYDKLYSSSALMHMELSEQQKQAAKKSSMFTGIGIAALALISILLIVFRSYIFTNPNSVLNKLGVSGNLGGIKELYVYGENVKDEYEIAQYILTEDGTNDMIRTDNLVYPIGNITDISDFKKMKNLEELCVCGNRVESIAPITGINSLRLLDISHNNGIDISGIDSLSNLETLNVAYTELEDYSALLNMPSLKKVYISANEVMTFNNLGSTPFEVLTVDKQVHSYEELKAALADSNNHAISIMNIIEIPEDETITIAKDQVLQGAGLANEVNVINNGTVNVYGGWEMGLCERINNGTINIKSGGVYTGGMCNTVNNGNFIIEKGGRQNLERGHEFVVADGLYQNDGCLSFGGGGQFRYDNGIFVNNGIILWNFGEYGPGFYINGSDATNNGKIYFNELTGTEGDSPYEFYDENNPQGIIIQIGEVNSKNR